MTEDLRLKKYKAYPYMVSVLVPYLGDVYSPEKVVCETQNSSAIFDCTSISLTQEDEKELKLDENVFNLKRFENKLLLKMENIGGRDHAIIKEDKSKLVKPPGTIRVTVRGCVLYYLEINETEIAFYVIPTSTGREPRSSKDWLGPTLGGEAKQTGVLENTHIWNHRLMCGTMKKKDLKNCHWISPVTSKEVSLKPWEKDLEDVLPMTVSGAGITNLFSVSLEISGNFWKFVFI